MTAKELFLTMESYEEFDKRRDELRALGELKFDQDVIDHMKKIFPKPYGGTEELYKLPPETQG